MDIISCGYCKRELGMINEIIANDVPARHMCFLKFQNVTIDTDNKMYGVDKQVHLKNPMNTGSRIPESKPIKDYESRPGTSYVSVHQSQIKLDQSMLIANNQRTTESSVEKDYDLQYISRPGTNYGLVHQSHRKQGQSMQIGNGNTQVRTTESSVMNDHNDFHYISTPGTSYSLCSHRDSQNSSQNSQIKHSQSINTEYDDSILTTNNNQSWTDGSVKALIHAYKDNIDKFSSPLYNKKKVWDKISEEINIHGFKFSGKKCDEKWRNLKKVYDKVLQNKKTTGSGPSHWAYFEEFHDIYFHDPRYNPIATVSSSGIIKKKCVETISMDSEGFSPGEKKRKRVLSTFDLDLKKQKRHEERMTLKREMFEWFKLNYTKPKESPSEVIVSTDEDST